MFTVRDLVSLPFHSLTSLLLVRLGVVKFFCPFVALKHCMSMIGADGEFRMVWY